MTRLGLFAERFIEAGWLAAVIAVPLYFNVFTSRVFEPDKLVILRCIVLFMLAAQVVSLIERRGRLPADRAQPPRGVLLAIAAFLGVNLLATVASVSPANSLWGSYNRLQGFYTLVTYVALAFLIAVHLRTRLQAERLARAALLVSLPIAVYGLVQHFRLDPLPWGGDVTFRVSSTMGNPIFLAAYLIMIVPWTLARLLAAHDAAGAWTAGGLVRAVPRGLRDLRLGVVVALFAGLAVLIKLNASQTGIWWLAIGVVGVVVLLLLVFERPRARPDPLVDLLGLAGLLVLQLACIVLTQSRGPQLGLLVGLLGVVVVLGVRQANRRLVAATVGLGAALVGFLVVFNLPGTPLQPLRDLPYIGRLGQLAEVEVGTGRVRVLIWKGAWQLFTAHPASGRDGDPLNALRPVIGYGPDAMHLAYNQVYPPELGQLEARNASPDRNHNVLLDQLIMTGVLGLLAYLALLVAVGRLVADRLRAAKSLTRQALVVGVAGGLLAHVVEAQVGIPIAASQTMFWASVGLLVALGLPETTGAPVAAPMPVVAASAPAPTGAARASRRGGRGDEARAPRGADPVRGRPLLPRGLAAGVFAVGFGGYGLLVLATRPYQVEFLYLAGFGWLVAALVAFALHDGLPVAAPPVRGNVLAVGGVALAVAAVGAWLNLSQLAADLYYKQGTVFSNQRRPAIAAAAHAQAINLAPGQDFYWLFLGRSLLELARDSALPGTTERPLSLDTLLRLTPTQFHSLNRTEALRASELALRQAVVIAPLNPDHYANLGRLYRYWGEAVDPSRLAAAITLYQQAVAVSPFTAHLHAELARSLHSAGNLAGAQAAAERALALDDTFAPTRVVLGDIALARGDWDRALEWHRQALGRDGRALLDDRFEDRTATYLQAGRAGALAALYQDAITQKPDDAALQRAYAFVLARQGRAVEALAVYERVISLDPNDWSSLRNLAVTYQSLGQTTEALRAAEAAKRVAPPSEEAQLTALIDALKRSGQN